MNSTAAVQFQSSFKTFEIISVPSSFTSELEFQGNSRAVSEQLQSSFKTIPEQFQRNLEELN